MMEVRLFLEAKFAFDKQHNIQNTYYVFLDNNLISAHDKDPKLGQKSEKQKVFRPTPLPRKLRLGPGGYWVDPDEDDK